MTTLHQKIATLAYELYEKSGRVQGRDLEHWLQAEKLVKEEASRNREVPPRAASERRRGQRRKKVES